MIRAEQILEKPPFPGVNKPCYLDAVIVEPQRAINIRGNTEREAILAAAPTQLQYM